MWDSGRVFDLQGNAGGGVVKIKVNFWVMVRVLEL